jgi:hypothetical protein
MCRRLRSIGLAATIMVLIAGLASPVSAGGPSCEDVVKQLRENGIDARTYGELLEIPLPYRHFAFGALSAEEKAAAWTSHLEAYLSSHPELTAAQAAVIQDALDLVRGPEIFAVQRGDSHWTASVQEPLRNLETKALAVFPRDQFKAIFTELGGDTTTTLPGGRKLATGAAVAYPVCNCSTLSDYCSGASYCLAGGCWKQTSGCGTFWRYACDGLCNL